MMFIDFFIFENKADATINKKMNDLAAVLKLWLILIPKYIISETLHIEKGPEVNI